MRVCHVFNMFQTKTVTQFWGTFEVKTISKFINQVAPSIVLPYGPEVRAYLFSLTLILLFLLSLYIVDL